MSDRRDVRRRRERRDRREAPRRTGPSRARGGRALRWGLGVALIAIAAFALWMVRRDGPRRARATAEGPVDPAAELAPQVAYERALALGRAGRHGKALPYYRRAITGVAEDFWDLHFNYGTALYNTTLVIESRHGTPLLGTRSSIERIERMRECLAELDRAESLAPTSDVVATIRSQRGRILQVWGLPWETFVAYRRAQEAAPGRGDLARMADAFMEVMEHPQGASSPEPQALP